eukprot:CAMPEP_0201510468 /NCGR_PEP_ID=MMETSP0161_2-20130828/3139_1 /ASSEMBLY_ACC=CAM_ASM_000251 /TAXON_ID=180227 /ORGANISM="Neoparamoeba aestuarina, Strain SoJaBio B1-5/56/2" /LENGTH=818 /DNA_ID=CAMNT_0047905641 /DNA_START=98 /DNA_END=2550 /DNA_ORIENTATION=-
MERILLLLVVVVGTLRAQACDTMDRTLSMCNIEGTNVGGVCTISGLTLDQKILSFMSFGSSSCDSLIIESLNITNSTFGTASFLANNYMNIQNLNFKQNTGTMLVIVGDPITDSSQNDVIEMRNSVWTDTTLAMSWTVGNQAVGLEGTWSASDGGEDNAAMSFTEWTIRDCDLQWTAQVIAEVVAEDGVSDIDLYGIFANRNTWVRSTIDFDWSVRDILSNSTGETYGIVVSRTEFEDSTLLGTLEIEGSIGFTRLFNENTTLPDDGPDEVVGILWNRNTFDGTTFEDLEWTLTSDAQLASLDSAIGIHFDNNDLTSATVEILVFEAVSASRVRGLNVFGVEITDTDFINTEIENFRVTYAGTLETIFSYGDFVINKGQGRAINWAGDGSGLEWSNGKLEFTGSLLICAQTLFSNRTCEVEGAIGIQFGVLLDGATISNVQFEATGSIRSGIPADSGDGVNAIYAPAVSGAEWDNARFRGCDFLTSGTIVIERDADVAPADAASPAGMYFDVSMVGTSIRGGSFTDSGDYDLRQEALTVIRFSSDMDSLDFRETTVATSGDYHFNENGAVLLFGRGSSSSMTNSFWLEIFFQIEGTMSGGPSSLDAVVFEEYTLDGSEWREIDFNVTISAREERNMDFSPADCRAFFFDNPSMDGMRVFDSVFFVDLDTTVETFSYFAFYWDNTDGTNFWDNTVWCNTRFSSPFRKHVFDSGTIDGLDFEQMDFFDSSIRADNITGGPIFSDQGTIVRSSFRTQLSANTASLDNLCNVQINEVNQTDFGSCGPSVTAFCAQGPPSPSPTPSPSPNPIPSPSPTPIPSP